MELMKTSFIFIRIKMGNMQRLVIQRSQQGKYTTNLISVDCPRPYKERR